MKTAILLTCSALVSMGAWSASLHDALGFKLDLRDPGLFNASKINFGNALDMANVGSFAGFANADETLTAQVKVETVESKVYPWQSMLAPVLYLPQPSHVNASDSSRYNVSATLLSIPYSPIITSAQTAFVRFRWDGATIPNQACMCWIGGNSYNWDAFQGWMIYLQSYANSDIAYVGISVGRESKAYSWDGGSGVLAIEKGKWYDLFATLDPIAANQTRVHFYLYATPATDPDWGYKRASAKENWTDINAALSFGDTGKVRIGAENGGPWYTSPANSNDGVAKSFRGSLAQFQIYSGLLSEAERCEVMAGTHGSTWEIGVANASAAEFNETDPVEVFVPSTNRWSQFPRELTQERPAVTIKDKIVAQEVGMNKILEINPIVSGNGPFNVEVSVNGTKVAAESLSSSRSIAIPKGVWQADGEGNVSVTITRVAPFDGTLAFDAVKLCGGWSIGGKMDMMTHENNVIPYHFVGQTDSKTMQRSSQVAPVNSIYFHVPESALGRFRYWFKTVIEGRSAATDVPQYSINGHLFSAFASVERNDVLEAEIPGEWLVAGKNELKISNGGWVSYKSFSILEKPKSGIVLLVK